MNQPKDQNRQVLQQFLEGDARPLKALKQQRVSKFTDKQIEERRQWLIRHHGNPNATRDDVFNFFGRYDHQTGLCYELPGGMKLFF